MLVYIFYSYGPTKLRKHFRIPKDVWESMVVSLVILMVHEDLFPPRRESMLRGIIKAHNVDTIIDEDDAIYKMVSAF